MKLSCFFKVFTIPLFFCFVFLLPYAAFSVPESAENKNGQENSISEPENKSNITEEEAPQEESDKEKEKSNSENSPEAEQNSILQPIAPHIISEPVVSQTTSYFKIPSLEILQDPSGNITINEIMQRLSDFTPWNPSEKIQHSISWFLFYESSDNHELNKLYLDLGSQIPKQTVVWFSHDGKTWQKEDKDIFGLYTIKGDLSSFFVLIRVDGYPGPWFKPMLSSQSASFATSTLFFRFAADIALGIFAFLSILLFVSSGKKQFFCIALLSSAALLQSFFAFPSSAESAKSGLLLSILSAGIAVLIFPHLGRIFLHTQKKHPFFDYYLLFCTLAGIAFVCLPYFKSFDRFSAYLTFWTLIAVPCLPPAFIFMLSGDKKTFFFFLSALSMAFSSSLAAYFFLKGTPLNYSYEIIRLGLILGILFVMLDMSPIKEPSEEIPNAVPITARQPESITSIAENPIPIKGDIISPEVLFDKIKVKTRIRANAFMDELVQNACNLNLALPSTLNLKVKKEILDYADKMVFASRQFVNTITDINELEDVCEENEDVPFELKKVISDALTEVFAEADKKGLGISWYISPFLNRFYQGDIKRILNLLSLLLSDSVRATKNGAISLQVTRAEDSINAGRIRFTLTDTGNAYYPLERNSILMQRTLELSGSSAGDFSMHCSAAGSNLSFVVQYVPLEDDGQTPLTLPNQKKNKQNTSSDKKGVLLICSNYLRRQRIMGILQSLPCSLWEADSIDTALNLYPLLPSTVIIFDGEISETEISHSISQFHTRQKNKTDIPLTFLLLAKNFSQALALKNAGCTESIFSCCFPAELTEMVVYMLNPQNMPRPSFAATNLSASDWDILLKKYNLKEIQSSPSAPASLTEKIAENQDLLSASLAKEKEISHSDIKNADALEVSINTEHTDHTEKSSDSPFSSREKKEETAVSTKSDSEKNVELLMIDNVISKGDTVPSSDEKLEFPSNLLRKKEKIVTEKCVVIQKEEQESGSAQQKELIVDIHSEESQHVLLPEEIPLDDPLPDAASLSLANKCIDPNSSIDSFIAEEKKADKKAIPFQNRLSLQREEKVKDRIPQIKPLMNKRVEKPVDLTAEQILDEKNEILSLDSEHIISAEEKMNISEIKQNGKKEIKN